MAALAGLGGFKSIGDHQIIPVVFGKRPKTRHRDDAATLVKVPLFQSADLNEDIQDGRLTIFNVPELRVGGDLSFHFREGALLRAEPQGLAHDLGERSPTVQRALHSLD